MALPSISRQTLTQLHLHLSPAPRSISESRAILNALERFGEVDMFKVVRFEGTTKEMSPKAHLIFRNENSASSLLAAGTILVPSTNIFVTPSKSIFRHEAYIEHASGPHLVRDVSIISRPTVVAKGDLELEDLSIRSDALVMPTEQKRAMRSRLISRYTGGFSGFKDLEAKIQKEKEKRRLDKEIRIKRENERRREDNARLARGEEVDLSGKSDAEILEDQLNTVRDLLGSLGEEKSNRV